MQDSVRTSTGSDLALLSLHSFRGMNTFPNIKAAYNNNTLKILTTYQNYNQSIQARTNYTHLATIVIPDGQYSLDDLLLFINTNVPYFSPSTATNLNLLYVAGFGDPTYNATSNSTYPAMAYSGGGKVNLYQYQTVMNASGYGTGYPLATNPVVYVSMELIVDSTTINLLQMLGFCLNTFNYNASLQDRLIMYFTPYASGGNTAYTISPGQITYSNNIASTSGLTGNVIADFIYDMNWIKDLYFCIGNTSSQNRATFAGLSTNDYLFTIPVTAPYGNQFTYQATLEEPAYIANLNLGQLQIIIKDEGGTEVDFQGSVWSCMILFKLAKDIERPDVNASDANMHTLPQVPLDMNATRGKPYSYNDDVLFGDKSQQNRLGANTKKPRFL